MRRQGFTLVELLVVIAIIAVLVSVLLPSLNRARDAALRIRCASNLQQWGVALTNYVTENRGDMPRAWGPVFGGQYPYTYRVRTNGPDVTLSPVTFPAVISLEMMRPYLKGVPADLSIGATNPKRLEGVWRCPVAYSDLEAVNAAQWDTNGWVYGDYCYYGRSDLWPQANMTNPEDIIRKKLEPDRLWMSDILFRWGTLVPSRWAYNHYRNAGAGAEQGYPSSIGLPQFRGMNQLFADGHVVWKTSDAFNVSLMEPPTPGPGCRFIHAGGSDTFFY